MAVEPRVVKLYRDLRTVRFDQGKSSQWENLTDVLEILAVAQGIKPAHLNGRGLRSEQLLVDLNEVSNRHGLLTRRARPHPPIRHREPNVEKEYLEWERERDRKQVARLPDVLWIYADLALEAKIDNLVVGEGDEAEILGYPSCCVKAHWEIMAKVTERLVAGYKSQHGAKTLQDLIRCYELDVPVMVDPPIHVRDDESRTRFRFVQFFACGPCIDQSESPAAEVNGRMRQLAADVDEQFVREIEQAA